MIRRLFKRRSKEPPEPAPTTDSKRATASAILYTVMGTSNLTIPIKDEHVDRLLGIVGDGWEAPAVVFAAKIICEDMRVAWCKEYLEFRGYSVTAESLEARGRVQSPPTGRDR